MKDIRDEKETNRLPKREYLKSKLAATVIQITVIAGLLTVIKFCDA